MIINQNTWNSSEQKKTLAFTVAVLKPRELVYFPSLQMLKTVLIMVLGNLVFKYAGDWIR